MYTPLFPSHGLLTHLLEYWKSSTLKQLPQHSRHSPLHVHLKIPPLKSLLIYKDLDQLRLVFLKPGFLQLTRTTTYFTFELDARFALQT